MMKKRSLIIIFLLIIFVALLSIKTEAKSYYIKNMDIQSTIIDNGDLEIEQTLEYVFNGEYNGIYMTIPVRIWK